MAKCNRCGTENFEGANFCAECGAPLKAWDNQTHEGWNQQSRQPWESQPQEGWDNQQYQQDWAGQSNQQYQQGWGGQPNQQYQQGWEQEPPYIRDGFGEKQYGQKNKIVAGLLAILLGSLGIHKFYLGYTSTGIIMLLVTLLTLGIGAVVMAIISLVEGIMYLTKNDYEFYQTYEVGQKKWF